MDRLEAGEIADAVLAELRATPYRELVSRLLDEVETREVTGSSGTEYQVEIHAMWDSGRPGDLRVMAAVDDGTLRGSFRPEVRDFVVAQDGTFQVRQRNGRQVTTVSAPMANAAVRRPGANGQSSNALEVRVAGDTISYVVNGTVVHSGPKGSVGTDGLTGVRVNHVLNVHVEGFAVGK
jgi:hypothetical protein